MANELPDKKGLTTMRRRSNEGNDDHEEAAAKQAERGGPPPALVIASSPISSALHEREGITTADASCGELSVNPAIDDAGMLLPGINTSSTRNPLAAVPSNNFHAPPPASAAGIVRREENEDDCEELLSIQHNAIQYQDPTASDHSQQSPRNNPSTTRISFPRPLPFQGQPRSNDSSSFSSSSWWAMDPFYPQGPAPQHNYYHDPGHQQHNNYYHSHCTTSSGASTTFSSNGNYPPPHQQPPQHNSYNYYDHGEFCWRDDHGNYQHHYHQSQEVQQQEAAVYNANRTNYYYSHPQAAGVTSTTVLSSTTAGGIVALAPDWGGPQVSSSMPSTIATPINERDDFYLHAGGGAPQMHSPGATHPGIASTTTVAGFFDHKQAARRVSSSSTAAARAPGSTTTSTDGAASFFMDDTKDHRPRTERGDAAGALNNFEKEQQHDHELLLQKHVDPPRPHDLVVGKNKRKTTRRLPSRRTTSNTSEEEASSLTTRKLVVSQKLPSSFSPGPCDVICARGRGARDHPGNIRFRSLIDKSVPRYDEAKSRMEKILVVSQIVDAVRQTSPGGRFVKKDKNDDRWMEVGDVLAREKVGQSLRERLDSKYKSSTRAKRRQRKMKEEAGSWQEDE